METRAIDIQTDFKDFDDFWAPFLGGQGSARAMPPPDPASTGRRAGTR
jgi:hypothetical protein